MSARASDRLAAKPIRAGGLCAIDGDNGYSFDPTEKLGRVGHWWINLSTRTINWSEDAYQIYGLNSANYTPDLESTFNFYHPDDRGLFATAINTAATEGIPFKIPLRLNRADGRCRDIIARGYTITEPNGVATHIFGVLIDITSDRYTEEVLRAENFRLQQLAYVDALTLLANRRQFDEALKTEWLRAIREQSPLSLVMLDIDQFKLFNDLYGHLAGDACLRIVAETLSANLRRPGDLVARYGGEEFALLLPGTTETGVLTLAQTVRGAIEALQLTHAGNAALGGIVTASFGVSTAYPAIDDPDNWLSLINISDVALYQAKRAGRNTVVAGSASSLVLPACSSISGSQISIL